MKVAANGQLASLFGSENRSLVLAVLASASKPLTGYRVARAFGGQKIKVNAELRRLEEVGFVRSSRGAKGGRTWVLEDEELRALVRKRMRIFFVDEWERLNLSKGRTVDRLLEEIEASLPSPKKSPEFYRPARWKPNRDVRRTIRELTRSPEKDAILRRHRARTSYRERKAS